MRGRYHKGPRAGDNAKGHEVKLERSMSGRAETQERHTSMHASSEQAAAAGEQTESGKKEIVDGWEN